ncbi:MAG: leucyl-tRNA synthetase, partial [Candidatus Peribacteria bacterium GW2011_GWB1_54_5]
MQRVWRLYSEKLPSGRKLNKKVDQVDAQVTSKLHATVKKVTEDIERLHFNTALSALMELLNVLEKQDVLAPDAARTYATLLAPLAPHLAEEVWEYSGGKGFVIDQDGNIALLSVGTYFGLPGGGIEEGETAEEAFVRECVEEIGVRISIERKLGVALQSRAKVVKQYQIHYFIARVVGQKGVPTTVQEDELAVQFGWYPIDKVRSLLEEQIPRIPLNGQKSDIPSDNYA